jgi:hypothetical protein
VIPVVIGETGTISKSRQKYPSNIPGKHDIKELQKTEHCTRGAESVNVQVQNIQHGQYITCTVPYIVTTE